MKERQRDEGRGTRDRGRGEQPRISDERNPEWVQLKPIVYVNAKNKMGYFGLWKDCEKICG
jgi:hypothetical protein